MQTTSRFNFATIWLATLLLLSGCSPQFDWREVRGATPAPYTVLLPAKPASMARAIKLGDVTTNMSMTAAEVAGITFAVGSAELADAAQAATALAAMKMAMVQNIKGSVRLEKAAATPAASSIEIEAVGHAANGQERLMLAHFIARGRHVYQVVLLGPKDGVSAEVAETFFGSFKPG